MKIDFTHSKTQNAAITAVSEDFCEVTLGNAGGGITLNEAKGTKKRYIVGCIEVMEDHSVAMTLRCYPKGADKDRIRIRFGLLPRFKTKVCFDLNWLDNGSIYTNRTPGTLKLVIHGQRTDVSDVDRFVLGMEKAFHDVRVRFENFALTDEYPMDFPIPDVKLTDEFGQWKNKDWPGKIHSFDELKKALAANEGEASYPFPEWNKWGGDSTRKLKEGTGFFSTIKTNDGRWHLTDPDGYDYFSLGPCGTRPGDFCRVDHLEKLCDWLPEQNDPMYRDLYTIGSRRRAAYMPMDSFKMVSFTALNLKRVYGDNWREKWEEISHHILMSHGINSQGNFPELAVNCGDTKIPYVRELPHFPVTDTLIFRDFPDVLSPEYEEKSKQYATKLAEWKDDPFLIGYFLRNEPEFHFVENLYIADEVLHNSAQTCCRAGFIHYLEEKYQTVEALNSSWGTEFQDFSSLEKPIDCCSAQYPGSMPDILHFSAFLIRKYIKVPSLNCRAVDSHHLNLGLRWSKANNPVMMAGWEYFDVFSINCYDFDPTSDMDFVLKAGVDRPVLIGEYHCGALDRGLTATGLKGVENQQERGVMWRYFVEKCAAHPLGVGAHWFQFNDQFCLGRYDGENYQIGMVDICMQPHKELMEAAIETSRVLYKVKNGEIAPYDRPPKAIPMIGY
jgi:hypothetical protein